jgi:hypothetical protein
LPLTGKNWREKFNNFALLAGFNFVRFADKKIVGKNGQNLRRNARVRVYFARLVVGNVDLARKNLRRNGNVGFYCAIVGKIKRRRFIIIPRFLVRLSSCLIFRRRGQTPEFFARLLRKRAALKSLGKIAALTALAIKIFHFIAADNRQNFPALVMFRSAKVWAKFAPQRKR